MIRTAFCACECVCVYTYIRISHIQQSTDLHETWYDMEDTPISHFLPSRLNNNTVAARVCEAGATLAPLAVRSCS
jgi:hypothetical protein